jgi:RNA polymerase sigma factor (sigma-70 family)
VAYLICGDWYLAEDAGSAALAKLYVGWHKACRADSLDAYVRGMLMHAIVDARRRPWRRERPSEDPIGDRPRQQPEHTEDRVVLRAALSQMPARRRAVLVLRFFEGLSVEETAAAMVLHHLVPRQLLATGE